MTHPNLKYVVGDATYPQGEGNKVIAHCCNDLGLWGVGFVLAISRRWGRPKRDYLQWARRRKDQGFDLPLGAAEIIKVEEDIWVANIIGQRGVGKNAYGKPPIRYDALASGLKSVYEWAKAQSASVHMPRMGSGLAGGDWNKIEQIVIEELCNKDISVTVYDPPK